MPKFNFLLKINLLRADIPERLRIIPEDEDEEVAEERRRLARLRAEPVILTPYYVSEMLRSHKEILNMLDYNGLEEIQINDENITFEIHNIRQVVLYPVTEQDFAMRPTDLYLSVQFTESDNLNIFNNPQYIYERWWADYVETENQVTHDTKVKHLYDITFEDAQMLLGYHRGHLYTILDEHAVNHERSRNHGQIIPRVHLSGNQYLMHILYIHAAVIDELPPEIARIVYGPERKMQLLLPLNRIRNRSLAPVITSTPQASLFNPIKNSPNKTTFYDLPSDMVGQVIRYLHPKSNNVGGRSKRKSKRRIRKSKRRIRNKNIKKTKRNKRGGTSNNQSSNPSQQQRQQQQQDKIIITQIKHPENGTYIPVEGETIEIVIPARRMKGYFPRWWDSRSIKVNRDIYTNSLHTLRVLVDVYYENYHLRPRLGPLAFETPEGRNQGWYDRLVTAPHMNPYKPEDNRQKKEIIVDFLINRDYILGYYVD